MDFAKRICAVRELFEETNLLFARRDEMRTNETPSLDNYNMKYKQDFVKFSKSCGITPDIDKMYSFHRIGTPIGLYPVNDTQFYLYF